ncbi:MAG: hypothetical protein JSU08_16050 [Acidobacteria bacterium]|nr:hypothetical protein [Acidobacteriota bacterium]
MQPDVPAAVFAPEGAWVFRPSVPQSCLPDRALSTARRGPLVAVFSGVLFEPDSLARELQCPSATGNAADLVLAAYISRGGEWVHALKGHFATVIHDGATGRIVAARDPMGLHPLFFARGSHGWVFSPSTDTLLAEPGVSRAVNRVALAEHLVHRWWEPTETYFEDVLRVPPGHVFEGDGRTHRLRRYWDPAGADGLRWLADEEVERFGAALTRAVNRCLDQGPAGIFLSGGFDSISVAAVAADETRRRGLPLPHALSLGFQDPSCNEELVQRGAADALGLVQEFLPFDQAVAPEGLLKLASDMAATWPVPMMNLWNPAYAALARRGREQGCRVILTGTGGDEWLNVSPYLAADLIRAGRLAEAARLVGVFHRSFKFATIDTLRSGLWTFGLRPLAAMFASRLAPAAFQARRVKKLVRDTPAWVAPDPALRRLLDERAPRVLASADPPGGSFYEQEMRTAIEHPLNAIEAEEYYEMGRRLGVRLLHPYCDADLVELLYRTPPATLVRGGRTKGLVRDTVARRFPTLGFDRQRKVSATDLYRHSLQTEGPAVWKAIGGARTLAALGVVDAKLHDAAIAGLFSGKLPRETYRIWDTLQLEAWARTRA